MENCIIIHGCPSDKEKAMDPETRTYDKHWIPWTKKELESRGVKTETPLMPEPWAPVYAAFKNELEKLDITEDTILIGHSCGCSFLVRWLGETKRKVKKLVLVAPWKIPTNDNQFKKIFYDFDIDETIKSRVNNITMFTADDEAEDGKRGLQMYHAAIGGKIINLEGHGHYTQGDMGTEEFPELIEVVTA